MKAFDPRHGKAYVRCDLDVCGCKKTTQIFVSDKHKYIYFAIGKCACTTLINSLPEMERIWTNDRLQKVMHRVYDSYFKFVFVRNPWDRMVSNYAMFIESDRAANRREIEAMFNKPQKSISFEEFIVSAKKIKNHHWSQCYEWIPRDKKGNLNVNFIGHVGNFESDLNEVLNKLDIKKEFEENAAKSFLDRRTNNITTDTINNGIVHLNRTDHTHYTEYYDDHTRKVVASLFAEDIKIFKFKFGD